MESVDIELLRPAFSPGDTPITDSPTLTRPGTLRAGLLFQLQKEPLVLYRFGNPAGAVIETRDTLHLGASIDLSRRFSMRLAIPLSWDWDSDVPELAAQGFGAGDLSVGGRAWLWSGGPFDVGTRLDLLLPVGAKEAWRGEESLRVVPGVVASAGVGRIALVGDVGVVIRETIDTGRDLTVGPELTANLAVRGDIWSEHLVAWTGVADRAGLTALFQGGAENVAELLVGAQVVPVKGIQLDLGAGKGISEGYGATQFRLFAGLSWTWLPPVGGPPVVVEAPPVPLETIPDTVIVTPIPPEEWKPDELAKVVQDQIVIREPIQFEFAKDTILPVSLPTLAEVAKILAGHPEIGHVVIEGHASEEGSHRYNYDLANLRSNAIFRELVGRGVYSARLSCRSMGEVAPVTPDTDPASLERNRRVNFHIVHRLQPGDPNPVQPATAPLPWTGESVTVTPLPPLPEPPRPQPADPDPIPDFTREEEE